MVCNTGFIQTHEESDAGIPSYLLKINFLFLHIQLHRICFILASRPFGQRFDRLWVDGSMVIQLFIYRSKNSNRLCKKLVCWAPDS